MSENKPITWFAPEMTGHEIGNLREVLDRNFLNDGPLTRRFEEKIAQRLGVTHCVAVTSGTAAITLALLAAGVASGDEVIVPNLTFIATANAVRLAGAIPILADIEPRRFTLTPDAVRRAITRRTKAIIPVDVNGRGAAYEFFEPFCQEHGLKLIVDAAEGLGSAYSGRPLGTFGDFGCFSFSANKLVTTGQGGMVVVNNPSLRDRLLEFKDQGRRKRGTGGDDLHPVTGYNFKFTDLQAAVGLAQLERLDMRCAQARQRDEWYRSALSDVAGVEFPDWESQPGEVRLWTDVLIDQRERVREALDREEIGHRAFWLPIHTQAAYADDMRADTFPVSVSISRRGIWLPSSFDISPDEVTRTADVIKRELNYPLRRKIDEGKAL